MFNLYTPTLKGMLVKLIICEEQRKEVIRKEETPVQEGMLVKLIKCEETEETSICYYCASNSS